MKILQHQLLIQISQSGYEAARLSTILEWKSLCYTPPDDIQAFTPVPLKSLFQGHSLWISSSESPELDYGASGFLLILI